MSTRQDFQLWHVELSEEHRRLCEDGVMNFFPRKRRRYARTVAAVGISAMLVYIGAQAATSATPAERSQVANPDSFSFSYDGDGVRALVPTPDASDRSSRSMSLYFSCDNDGRLTVENTSNGYIKAFDKKTINEMIASGVAKTNPCDNGLSLDNTTDLGRIAAINGFATYSVPNDSVANH